VFGWVWSPFHSFVSFNFVFGHSVFHGYHARFFPGNVRFVGRDRFVRWVPERPGVVASRTLPRGDTRLTRWNRPVDRGSVRVRHDGGAPAAWEGGGAVRAPVTRNRTLGTSPARTGNRGDRAPAFRHGGGERSFSRGGGRTSGNPGVRTDPGRSFVGRAPARQTGDLSRGITDGRSRRNATAAGNRGFDRGFRSPASGGGGSGSFRSSASSSRGGGSFRSPASSGRGGGGGGSRGSRGVR
jgi:hypothetical protein